MPHRLVRVNRSPMLPLSSSLLPIDASGNGWASALLYHLRCNLGAIDTRGRHDMGRQTSELACSGSELSAKTMLKDNPMPIVRRPRSTLMAETKNPVSNVPRSLKGSKLGTA